MKKVATIILNRNLPTITDKLFNLIKKFNNKHTDIFVVDSGSLKKNKSKKTTWAADWKLAKIVSVVSLINGKLFKDSAELSLGDMKEVVAIYGEGGKDFTYKIASRVTIPVKPNINHLRSFNGLTNFLRSISSV